MANSMADGGLSGLSLHQVSQVSHSSQFEPDSTSFVGGTGASSMSPATQDLTWSVHGALRSPIPTVDEEGNFVVTQGSLSDSDTSAEAPAVDARAISPDSSSLSSVSSTRLGLEHVQPGRGEPVRSVSVIVPSPSSSEFDKNVSEIQN